MRLHQRATLPAARYLKVIKVLQIAFFFERSAKHRLMQGINPELLNLSVSSTYPHLSRHSGLLGHKGQDMPLRCQPLQNRLPS